MVDGPYLRQDVWEEWRKGHDANMSRLLTHIGNQEQFNINIAKEVTEVATVQAHQTQKVERKTVWLSTVVSAIVGSILGWFGGR